MDTENTEDIEDKVVYKSREFIEQFKRMENKVFKKIVYSLYMPVALIKYIFNDINVSMVTQQSKKTEVINQSLNMVT